jgi:hypothetical protein
MAFNASGGKPPFPTCKWNQLEWSLICFVVT